jgi:hypothetical protein
MQAEIMALLAQLDLRDRGPDLLPDQDLQADPTPYLILFGAGFVIAALGHLTRTKTLVALGVTMVFLATLILPLAYALTSD